MKPITSDYKNAIKTFGKEIDSIITFGETELGKEQLNSVTPHYESSMLKSVMKQLDIDSNVEIPLGTILNYQFGVKVGNSYEYIDYGNYVVYNVEKQEDTRSWKITCYDKMLYSMKSYENIGVSYPITIREYINALCTKLGLTFANSDDEFVNFDKEIQSELYLDAEGNSLDYTYRDVFDELAQVTASVICINNNDELEIRYVNNTGTYDTKEGKSISIPNLDDENDFDIELNGDTTQTTTTEGNQLFDKNNAHILNAKYGSTVTADNNERMLYIPCQPSTTYTLYHIATSPMRNSIGTTQTVPAVGVTIEDGVYSSTSPKTITTNANAKYIVWQFYAMNDTQHTLQEVIDSIMINKGSSALPYEDYVPNSPNPDYPQEVKTVTGKQDINVVGRQLIDFANPTTLTQSTTSTFEDNTITVTSTTGTYKRADWDILQLILANAGKTLKFTYKAINDNPAKSVQIRIRNNGTYSYYNLLTGNCNIPSDVSKITEALFQVYANNSSTSQSVTTVITEPMLQFGTTALPYEEYEGKTFEINLGKNLLPTDLQTLKTNNTSGTWSDNSYTYNGITFTYNDDGTIRATGSSSSASYITLASNFELNGTFTLSTGLGISANYYARVLDRNNGYAIVMRTDSNSPTATINTSTNVLIYIKSGLSNIDVLFKPMIEKGSQATSYSPYKTPIELCKIGNYQDYIKKSSGKNLLPNNNTTQTINGITFTKNSGGSIKLTNTSSAVADYYFVGDSSTYVDLELPTGTYNLNGASGGSGTTYMLYCVQNRNGTLSYIQSYTSEGTNISIQSGDTFRIFIRVMSGQTPNATIYPQLEKNNQATTYEPYGHNWYICKNIGKVVIDGTQGTFSNPSANRYNIDNLITDYYKNQYNITYVSNYYKAFAQTGDNASFNTFVANENYGFNLSSSSASYTIRFKNIDISTTDNFKTWLGNHNTTVYYVLNTPTYTVIEDSELINQLENIKLLEGENNIIILSGDLSSPIKMTYLAEMDSIDEEYLKDVNVTFGEKYGKVNSVVLSRSAESDNIYQRNEDSIAEDGLCEIKIKDNQILNGNNRDEFLPGIFEKLFGLEYYLNDYSSPGITFYELLDRYKVKIGDTYYKTIMFNDEVDVTQGLQESVHADALDESETDYKKADKTDRRINQAYIIVDKQNQEINSVVQNLQTTVNSQGEQIDALGTRITQSIDDITASVTSVQETLDSGVNLVKTTTVTVDDNGLSVSTDTSRISTTMDNDSFEVKDSGNNTLAFIGYDEEEGISKAEMNNLTVTNYLVTGVHRIEKMTIDGEDRTGFFYLGG